MDDRHVCPECNKSVKHLAPHLKNKHKWRSVTFKDNLKELELAETHPVYPLTPDPVKMDQYGEEKPNSDIILESSVMQRFDQLGRVGALRSFNAIRET